MQNAHEVLSPPSLQKKSPDERHTVESGDRKRIALDEKSTNGKSNTANVQLKSKSTTITTTTVKNWDMFAEQDNVENNDVIRKFDIILYICNAMIIFTDSICLTVAEFRTHASQLS